MHAFFCAPHLDEISVCAKVPIDAVADEPERAEPRLEERCPNCERVLKLPT